MSKPRYRWWGFARRMIRDYRILKAEYDDLHSQSITAKTSGMPGGGGNHRAIETIAMRTLPGDDQKVYDAVTKAIELVGLRPDGKERLALIRYVYWNRKERRVKDAAVQANVSQRTAERWHADFVRLVGMCYGFEVKLAVTSQKDMLESVQLKESEEHHGSDQTQPPGS